MSVSVCHQFPAIAWGHIRSPGTEKKPDLEYQSVTCIFRTFFFICICASAALQYLGRRTDWRITEVAQYYNEDGAIGYTFKYFLEGLNQEENVKILSFDGIYPNVENIKNQSYPISTFLYCVTLKSNEKENVKKLKEFLLSSQGQYIIEKTGYCGLN